LSAVRRCFLNQDCSWIRSEFCSKKLYNLEYTMRSSSFPKQLDLVKKMTDNGSKMMKMKKLMGLDFFDSAIQTQMKMMKYQVKKMNQTQLQTTETNDALIILFNWTPIIETRNYGFRENFIVYNFPEEHVFKEWIVIREKNTYKSQLKLTISNSFENFAIFDIQRIPESIQSSEEELVPSDTSIKVSFIASKSFRIGDSITGTSGKIYIASMKNFFKKLVFGIFCPESTR
ncbi:hypothetical protein BpHYR1_029781, partial [Brachionus plicatilis]